MNHIDEAKLFEKVQKWLLEFTSGKKKKFSVVEAINSLIGDSPVIEDEKQV